MVLQQPELHPVDAHPRRTSGLIVHEWIERTGGAEKVLDAVADAFPDADIACLWNDAPGRYPGRNVIESPLGRSPLRGRKALALPLMPAVWRNLQREPRLAGSYDWAVISSHLFAHQATHASVPADRTFVYAHTPARYLWTPELDERGKSLAVRSVAPAFRMLDRARGSRLQNVAANSRFVRDRIRDTWGVDAHVVHPPVDVAGLTAVADWSTRLTPEEAAVLEALPTAFLLGASRFVPYKRLDHVIDAGSAADLPVVIAGSGPEEAALRARAAEATVPVTFVIEPSDVLLRAIMQRALAYVFPPVEDFGIMPVEAMALGTPVVVNALGGASESVVDGLTGVAVHPRLDPAETAAAALRAAGMSALDCVQRARAFDTAIFRRTMTDWVLLGHEPASA